MLAIRRRFLQDDMKIDYRLTDIVYVVKVHSLVGIEGRLCGGSHGFYLRGVRCSVGVRSSDHASYPSKSNQRNNAAVPVCSISHGLRMESHQRDVTEIPLSNDNDEAQALPPNVPSSSSL